MFRQTAPDAKARVKPLGNVAQHVEKSADRRLTPGEPNDGRHRDRVIGVSFLEKHRLVDTSSLAPFLAHVLRDATIPHLPNHYRGKVRDNYDLPDGRRILIASDRLSAFDIILTALPFKGEVLTQVARFWFDATRDICANHVVEYPDPNVLVCRRLKIMPVEIVVRDYLAGTTSTSIWSMYKAGKRTMYGVTLPDGMRENQKLDASIITPTTKAMDGAHDAPLTPDEIVGHGLLTASQWQETTRLALALFARGREIASGRGLILVDTKYELGKTADGEIIVIDEIHTPDSSRFWLESSYADRMTQGLDPEPLDKDFVRRYYTALDYRGDGEPPPLPSDVRVGAAKRYIEAYERITGETFEPDTQPPIERIAKNLGVSAS